MRLIWILGLALAATIATAKADDHVAPGQMVKVICAQSLDGTKDSGATLTRKLNEIAANGTITQVSPPSVGGAGYAVREVCVTVFYTPK